MIALEKRLKVETCIRWFGHVVRRLVKAPTKRVNQIEGCPIARGRGRSNYQ